VHSTTLRPITNLTVPLRHLFSIGNNHTIDRKKLSRISTSDLKAVYPTHLQLPCVDVIMRHCCGTNVSLAVGTPFARHPLLMAMRVSVILSWNMSILRLFDELSWTAVRNTSFSNATTNSKKMKHLSGSGNHILPAINFFSHRLRNSQKIVRFNAKHWGSFSARFFAHFPSVLLARTLVVKLFSPPLAPSTHPLAPANRKISGN